jgi:hypothetical protein
MHPQMQPTGTAVKFIIQGLECSQDDVINLQNELRGVKEI